MSYRYGCTLLAMMLGLLVALGCANGRLGTPATTTVLCPSQPCGGTSGELTPAQAAHLCLTTAEALEKKGYTAEAIRQYENARGHDPHLSSVSRRLAVLYDLQGDPRRAEAEYQHAQQEQPSNAELLNDLGYFHYRHDRLDAAATWLHNAVLIDPNCRHAWINLGQVLAKQGRLEESYRAFARVLQPAEAYSNLGVLLAKQGRTSEARTALQQALQLDPTLQQPQAFLSALPSAPASLPAGLTHTNPPAPMTPPAPPPATVVVAPPSPPAPPPATVVVASPATPSQERTAPPSSSAYRPPTPSILPTPPAPLPVAQTSPAPLPTIRAVRQPATDTALLLPPAIPPTPVFPSAVKTAPPTSSIVCSPALPIILHHSPTPSPQPAKPFILHVSPPIPAVAKTEIRQPQVVITDCQGEPENTPP